MITTQLNDIKERLSVGYTTLIAARAGCEVAEGSVDRESRDVSIRPIQGMPVAIDVQLKATSTLVEENGEIVYDLPIKNYNDLRNPIVANARILVILDLTVDQGKWLVSTDDRTIFERCAYWASLYGEPLSTNATKKRIRIPKDQTFNADSLLEILERRYEKIKLQDGGL